MDSKIKKFPSEEVSEIIRKKMVMLRKQGSTLEEIASNFNLSLYQVSTILKEELTDTYNQFSQKKRWTLTPEEVDKIIKLRKGYSTIGNISKRLKIPFYIISRVLSEEFNGTSNHRSRPDSYENIKKRSARNLKKVKSLRNSGKSISEIEEKTGFTKGFITRFLTDMPGEYLKPQRVQNIKAPLTEEDVLAHLNEAYNTITAKILNLSYSSITEDEKAKKFKTLKTLYISAFREMWNSLPKNSPYRSPGTICLPFIFYFLRLNNIYLDTTMFLHQYDYGKPKWFGSLKRIHNHLANYTYRDRNQVILDKIKELQQFFNLSGRFYTNAEIIMNKLWRYLSNGIDKVIVATVSTLSLFSIHDDLISTHHICKRIRISQSVVIYQIKNKVIDPLKIDGFTTLKASKELIQKELLEKIIGLNSTKSFPRVGNLGHFPIVGKL